MMDSDQRLMQAVAAGDTTAFAQLLNRHSAAVLNCCYRIVGDRSEAEDLCQEVFETLWQQAASWRPQAQLRTWLFRVASNRSINYRQRVQQRLALADEPAALITEQGDGVESGLADQPELDLEGLLMQLPENQRMAIYFRYYQGLGNSDIAEILQLSPKAVESLLARARKQLKHKLGNTPYRPESRPPQERCL